MADSIFGRSLQEARRVANASLTAFPVNSTAILHALVLPAGHGKVRIEKISWVASAALNDADGTMLVTVTARDKSEAADDVLVNAASVEAGTANESADFTLEADSTEKIFTLEEGDSVRVSFVNNSAAIDTNGAISVYITYFPVPAYEAGPGVQHASAYTA
jgi:hypothetical protein